MAVYYSNNPSVDPNNAVNQSLLYFFTPAQIAEMPDDVKSSLAAFADVQKKNYEAGATNADINAQTWNDAMKEAQSDPLITAKYGDALNTSINSVNTTLDALTKNYQQNQASTQRQQVVDTRNLNQTEDAQGQAYSGFRAQAQQKLAADQGDVIKSSLATLKQGVQSTVAPFENKFGTNALNQIEGMGIPGAQYTETGNVTGTQAAAENADVRSLATQNYNLTTGTSGASTSSPASGSA